MTAMTHSQLPQTSYPAAFPHAEQSQLPHLAQQIAQDHVPAQLAQQFVPPQVAQMFVPEHIARQFVPPQIAQQIAMETLRTRATLFQALSQQQPQSFGQHPYALQPFGQQPFGQQQPYSQQQMPQYQQSPQHQQLPQYQQQYAPGASWLTQLASSQFGQLQSGYPQF